MEANRETPARDEPGLNPKDRPAKVLVVDDNEVNREMLREALETKGYRVLLAEDGGRAIAAALDHLPDLVLLDVMMPGMNGFETCSRLKQEPRTREIPVIFITAKIETRDLVQGFEVGGVDYVTKPVKVAEVLARVETHLKLRRLERERAETLGLKLRADHWRAIKTISEGLAHNFNNILAAAMGNLQYLRHCLEEPQLIEAVDDGLKSLERAERLIRLLQQFQELGADTAPFTVDRMVEEIITPFRLTLGPEIRFELQVSPGLPPLLTGSGPYISQALQAVLENAREALINREGKIMVSAAMMNRGENGEDRKLVIEVCDTGPGLSPEVAEKAFLPFFSTKNTVGVGLGLYASRIALEQVGGQIEIQNLPGQGARAIIDLLSETEPATGPGPEVVRIGNP